MNRREGETRPLFTIGLGFLSALLYCTVFVALAFLLPLLVVGARKGYKSMLAASSLSALLIASFQLVLVLSAGAPVSGELFIGLLPPLGMIVGILLAVAPLGDRLSFVSRLLLGGAITSLSVLPSVLYLPSSPEFVASVDLVFAQMGTLVSSGLPSAEDFRIQLVQMVERGFGPSLFLYLYLNTLIGSRFVALVALPAISDATSTVPQPEPREAGPVIKQPSTPANLEFQPPLPNFRVPLWMVWFLLASWAVILLSRYFPFRGLDAAAWNIALCFSVCYAIQGLAVLYVRLMYSRMAPASRFIVTMTVVLIAVGGLVGIVVAAIMSLVGTLETWIPLRNIPKGEQP